MSTLKNGSGDKSSSPPFELSFGGNKILVISDEILTKHTRDRASEITQSSSPPNESSNGGDELLSPLPFFEVEIWVLFFWTKNKLNILKHNLVNESKSSISKYKIVSILLKII